LTIGLLRAQDKSVKLQASNANERKTIQEHNHVEEDGPPPTDPNSELAVTGPKENRKQPNQETGQTLVL
jgi:hypothetical protein